MKTNQCNKQPDDSMVLLILLWLFKDIAQLCKTIGNGYNHSHFRDLFWPLRKVGMEAGPWMESRTWIGRYAERKTHTPSRRAHWERARPCSSTTNELGGWTRQDGWGEGQGWAGEDLETLIRSPDFALHTGEKHRRFLIWDEKIRSGVDLCSRQELLEGGRLNGRQETRGRGTLRRRAPGFSCFFG